MGDDVADNMKTFNEKVIAEFRANGGKVGGMFEGAPLAILHTTGAKSGQPREIPIVIDHDDDRIVVIASKGGAPTNPDWYHNLVVNPELTVELGTETFRGRATEVTGAERDRLYAQVAEKMPNFAEYQRNTDRIIPVFTIERVA